MNTTTARTQAPAPRSLMRAGLLSLLCAGSLLVCQRTHAVEADGVVASLETAVHEAAAETPAPRTGRLLLAVTRLGERVMRLAPWHHQAAMQQAAGHLSAVAEDSAATTSDSVAPSREAWNLKASPDPLVALIQMSRPTLRLAGGPEISLRVLGGVGVTLRSQF
jgi:hypothetical protein